MTNPESLDLVGQADSGSAKGRLGRVVQVAAIHRVPSGHGTDGDEGAVAPRPEQGKHSTINVQRPKDVGLELPQSLLGRRLLDRSRLNVSCVVDNDIDGSPNPGQFVDSFSYLRKIIVVVKADGLYIFLVGEIFDILRIA